MIRMPNIEKEIHDFQTAELGEEVRGSLVALARKLNDVVEQGVAQAASLQQSIDTANQKIQSLQTLSGQAQAIKDHVDEVNEEIDAKLVNASNVVPDVSALKQWRAAIEDGDTRVPYAKAQADQPTSLVDAMNEEG